jgi:hypothetical protein
MTPEAPALPGVTIDFDARICLVSGHKWTPAAEALDPHDAGAGSVVSYAGDGDDTVLLVCQRCGHQKAIGVEDFRRFISGPSGYGSRIDP